MRVFIPLLMQLVLALMAATDAHAAIAGPSPGVPGLLCRTAIGSAEPGQAIPPHLMAAIGRVESGRRDEASGVSHPWPWTVNAEGQGFFFDSKAQAIAAVRGMQARGVRSIDVGCMQVNLMHHPDAFASLDQAFDPSANAAYAARFLHQLYTQSGTWAKAVALYHSATPELAEPYARKVMAIWPEESKRPDPPTALANAWAATLAHGDFTPFRRNLGSVAPATTSVTGGLMGTGRGLDLYRSQPVGLNMKLRRQVGRF